MRGISKSKIIDKKQNEEAEFEKWYSSDSSLQKKYTSVLPLIERAIKSRRELNISIQFMMEGLFRSVEPILFSFGFNALYDELSKKEPDQKKVSELVTQQKQIADQFFGDYSYNTDIRIAEAMIRMLKKEVSPDYLPQEFSLIDKKYKGNVGKYVSELYEKSVFTDPDRLKKFMADPQVKVLREDKLFQFALSSVHKYREMNRSMNFITQVLAGAERTYIMGLKEMHKDKSFYPDANFTMRLTYGKVKGYTPQDAVKYEYFTTLGGVMAKEDPASEEFTIPSRLKVLYYTKDYAPYSGSDVMPVCFITDNDITGGNSGSPVLNGKGEIVGLAFDGNWDAMTGDIVYDPDLQRTICVDIRYILFLIDKYAGARYLFNEMNIIK